MVNCCIFGCKNRSSNANYREHGVSYHMFPKNPATWGLWIKACCRAPSWAPKRTSVVCSAHFEPHQFKELPNKRRILVEYAVPTLHLALRLKVETAKDRNRKVTVEIDGVASNTPDTAHTTSSMPGRGSASSLKKADVKRSLAAPAIHLVSEVTIPPKVQSDQILEPGIKRNFGLADTILSASANDTNVYSTKEVQLILGDIAENSKKKLNAELSVKNKKIRSLQARIRYLGSRNQQLCGKKLDEELKEYPTSEEDAEDIVDTGPDAERSREKKKFKSKIRQLLLQCRRQQAQIIDLESEKNRDQNKAPDRPEDGIGFDDDDSPATDDESSETPESTPAASDPADEVLALKKQLKTVLKENEALKKKNEALEMKIKELVKRNADIKTNTVTAKSKGQEPKNEEMPRKTRTAKSYAKKALRMNEVLKSRKRQIEEKTADCSGTKTSETVDINMEKDLLSNHQIIIADPVPGPSTQPFGSPFVQNQPSASPIGLNQQITSGQSQPFSSPLVTPLGFLPIASSDGGTLTLDAAAGMLLINSKVGTLPSVSPLENSNLMTSATGKAGSDPLSLSEEIKLEPNEIKMEPDDADDCERYLFLEPELN